MIEWLKAAVCFVFGHDIRMGYPAAKFRILWCDRCDKTIFPDIK